MFEVKGLSDNKKYFCEVHVDDKIYARTSSKKMKTTCFWGEYFGFLSLPKKAEKVRTLKDKDSISLIFAGDHPDLQRQRSSKNKAEASWTSQDLRLQHSIEA